MKKTAYVILSKQIGGDVNKTVEVDHQVINYKRDCFKKSPKNFRAKRSLPHIFRKTFLSTIISGQFHVDPEIWALRSNGVKTSFGPRRTLVTISKMIFSAEFHKNVQSAACRWPLNINFCHVNAPVYSTNGPGSEKLRLVIVKVISWCHRCKNQIETVETKDG